MKETDNIDYFDKISKFFSYLGCYKRIVTISWKYECKYKLLILSSADEDHCPNITIKRTSDIKESIMLKDLYYLLSNWYCLYLNRLSNGEIDNLAATRKVNEL